MTSTYREVGESTQKASLRPVVATIEHELSRLADGTPVDGEVIEAAFSVVGVHQFFIAQVSHVGISLEGLAATPVITGSSASRNF